LPGSLEGDPTCRRESQEINQSTGFRQSSSHPLRRFTCQPGFTLKIPVTSVSFDSRLFLIRKCLCNRPPVIAELRLGSRLHRFLQISLSHRPNERGLPFCQIGQSLLPRLFDETVESAD